MSRGFRTSRLIAPLAIAMVLGSAGTALAGFTVEPVVVEKGYQDVPFGNDTYLAYSTYTRSRGEIDVVATGGLLKGEFKLNANRSDAWAGNFDPGTDVVVFQQIKRGESDVFTYDLSGGGRDPVADVNTSRWEFSPRISNSYILYTVNHRRRGRWYDTIYLYDRVGGTTMKVANFRTGDTGVAYSSFVGEDWASWTFCKSTCKLFVYEIATDDVTKVPTVNDRPQYTGWIDETNGMLYFVRSANACGKKVFLRRAALASLEASSPLYALPDGTDIGTGISLAPGDVGQDLLFPELSCTSVQGDIYAVRSVA